MSSGLLEGDFDQCWC